MPERYPEFAARLRQAMKEARVAGKSLADAVGVRPQTVTAWRNGESMPEAERISVVARRLRVDASWLGGTSIAVAPAVDPVAGLVQAAAEELRLWLLSFAERLAAAVDARDRAPEARWITDGEIRADMALMDEVHARVAAAKPSTSRRRKTGS